MGREHGLVSGLNRWGRWQRGCIHTLQKEQREGTSGGQEAPRGRFSAPAVISGEVNWTPDERARFLRDYLASGETQEEFCRGPGRPSERALRSWLAAARKPADVREAARDIVQKAVWDLQRLLNTFDTVGDVEARDGQDLASLATGAAAAGCLEAIEQPLREFAEAAAGSSQQHAKPAVTEIFEAGAASHPEIGPDSAEVEAATSACRPARPAEHVEAATQERPRRRGLVADWL